jgi:branched-chain amino acid transport system substrate-binding protein
MRDSRWILPLALILASAIIIVPMAGCGSDADEEVVAQDEQPYRIGAVLSLSGTYAGLGAPEQKAIELEVARINESGGVNGHLIEVIIEDDATDSAAAVTAVTRLIDQEDVVAVLGATGTGATMAIRGDINAAGIPQVSPAGGTVVTSDFDPLVFQTPWSNTLVAPFTFEYLEGQGISKIALISDSGGFGKDGAAVVADLITGFDIEIVATEEFNPGDADMTAQMTKIKGSGAEAVMIVSAGKEAAIVASNMDQLGLEIPLIGTHGNARMEFIEGAGDAAEGFVFAAGKILIPESYGTDTENYEVAMDFIDRYTEAYGEAPNTFAGHAYDALHIIVDALGRVDGEVTGESLRDAIVDTSDFVGIGGTFNYSADDHNGMAASDLVMYRVEDGAWVLAE